MKRAALFALAIAGLLWASPTSRTIAADEKASAKLPAPDADGNNNSAWATQNWNNTTVQVQVSNNPAVLTPTDSWQFSEVGSLGPGSHVIRLGQETRWAPGVYWLRLTQERQSLTARGLILR